jgi:Tfp pilus assembly protein PilV
MNASRGFSTLEIMIAMTVLLLAFSATMMLLPTVQNGSVDTQIAVEALNIAEKMLENQQALARKDFKLVTAPRPARSRSSAPSRAGPGTATCGGRS